MDVREIMTANPLTVSKSDSLDELMRIMEINQLRHLPVMDGGTLLGVLSDRDLLAATGWRSARDRKEAGTAGDLIRGKPVCCSPDDSVVMIAVDLTSRLIGCLPVLEGEMLVGIVTEMDLLAAYAKLAGEGKGPKQMLEPVEQLMSTSVSTLAPTSTLEDALELEEARAVHHIPVVEDQRLVGILSNRDLAQALGAELALSTPVSTFMSADPLTIEPQEPLSRAAMYLLDGKISALPVTDDDRLVGILTLSDLLDHCIVNLRQPDSYSSDS